MASSFKWFESVPDYWEVRVKGHSRAMNFQGIYISISMDMELPFKIQREIQEFPVRLAIHENPAKSP